MVPEDTCTGADFGNIPYEALCIVETEAVDRITAASEDGRLHDVEDLTEVVEEIRAEMRERRRDRRRFDKNVGADSEMPLRINDVPR